MSRINEELKNMRIDVGLIKKINCSGAESKEYKKIIDENGTLPDGVFVEKNIYNENMGYFYRLDTPDITESEKFEYILLKQYKKLNTIKNCLIFFVVLTVIVLILALLGFFS